MTWKRDCKPFDLPSLEMSGDVFGGVYFLKWHHLSFLCLSTLCLLFQNVLSLLTDPCFLQRSETVFLVVV